MKSNQTYAITLVEYAYGPAFSNAMVYSGYYEMTGTTAVEYVIGVIEGPSGILLVDCGYDPQHEVAGRESRAQNHIKYQHPTKVLKKAGFNPEDVSGILLTHLHWDHADCLECFPNAKIYVQKDELFGWIETLSMPKEYNTLKISVDICDIKECINALGEDRLVLLDGSVEDLFPGIDITVAPNGHSWAGSLITVNTKDGKYTFTGDTAYVKDNILGGRHDGVSMPNGYNCGSVKNVLITMQDILRLAQGDMNKVLISHDIGVWDCFESITTPEDDLRIAYVAK